MELVKTLINFILHIDKNLLVITHQYGALSYLFLFVVIFMETGFVVTPFLPGDSLLFAAGSLAAFGSFNIFFLVAMCILAAFVGDTLNYWIGRELGAKLFAKENFFFRKSHLKKAEDFYAKHGGFAIILSRFVPIVRTFAPFVAGMGKMKYTTFLLYNIIGGALWVLLFSLAGFFFGNVPFIKAHFEYAMIVIVAISVVPIAIEVIKSKMHKS